MSSRPLFSDLSRAGSDAKGSLAAPAGFVEDRCAENGVDNGADSGVEEVARGASVAATEPCLDAMRRSWGRSSCDGNRGAIDRRTILFSSLNGSP